MAQPYVGEIRMFAGNFAPAGWAWCDGQEVPIAEYETLFQLIGTTFGGDGESKFVLPDLRGRLPLHQGNGYALADAGGVEEVTLTVNQLPAHNHPAAAAGRATTSNPSSQLWADWPDTPYSSERPTVALDARAIQPAGGSQPHDNMPPYLAVSFIISLFGIFPSLT